jgi:hypothetical protein
MTRQLSDKSINLITGYMSDFPMLPYGRYVDPLLNAFDTVCYAAVALHNLGLRNATYDALWAEKYRLGHRILARIKREKAK